MQNLKKALRIIIPFILIPGLVAAGALLPDGRGYVFAIPVIAAAALVFFFMSYEKKKARARSLVIVAVMTTLSVLGRLAFAWVPAFKPITAIVIITAIYMGGESGFLVGVLTAAVSNLFFGQGPWTPLQMLAWGLIGLAAGALAGPLRRSRVLLVVYGALSGVLFSLIMDVWTVLWMSGGVEPGLYLAAIIAAAPYTAGYAAGNVVFLLLLTRPIGERLERIRLKYGF